MDCASGKKDGSSKTHLQKRQRTDDNVRSVMLNSDVLDCPVCFERFTPPIFQCDNGHLACSSCCPKLSNNCPVCGLPVGHNRCRAMEGVLESAFVRCPNAKLGCTKTVSYGTESIHEKECTFSLCSCPVRDCRYAGSYKNLYSHYCVTHFDLTHPKMFLFDWFTCGTSLSAQMNISDGIIILMEYMKHLLFAVQCFRESYGVYVTVSCIAPSAPEVGEFSYHLSYTFDEHTMTYESPKVKRILKLSFETPQENFMLIPHSFLRGELLDLKLCIKKLNKIKKVTGEVE